MLDCGVESDDDAYSSLFSCCSHGGLIHEGSRHFVNIYKVHSIKPSMMHHSCIIVMLGRGGYLDEALEYIDSWRLNDPILWPTLLGLYTYEGHFEDVIKVREEMDDKKVVKQP
ncbi:UNVERIFIED_CONTAM: Pentatricopeptide repeat-containing protein, partial [Sesamum radiatum]